MVRNGETLAPNNDQFRPMYRLTPEAQKSMRLVGAALLRVGRGAVGTIVATPSLRSKEGATLIAAGLETSVPVTSDGLLRHHEIEASELVRNLETWLNTLRYEGPNDTVAVMSRRAILALLSVTDSEKYPLWRVDERETDPSTLYIPTSSITTLKLVPDGLAQVEAVGVDASDFDEAV